MVKVIYPITWMAGREGEAADVIHEIAEEMMEHRADLLRNASGVPEGDCQIYRKQASLLEEYATVLDAIYFQLEPERWNPETSKEMLALAQAYHVDLPGWMLPDWMKPVNTRDEERIQEAIEAEVNRFDNEGGRIAPLNRDLPA